MTLELYPLRFCFEARDSIYFPAGKPGNILRGGFGLIFKRIACRPDCQDARTCPMRAECAYARIFEPSALQPGPSGFVDWPRPFVFRAAHLDGWTFQPGQHFHFDLNLFELSDTSVAYFVLAFSELGREGIGPRRGKARLESVWQLDRHGEPKTSAFNAGEGTTQLAPPLSIVLDPSGEPVHSVRIEFVTPTELKSGRELAARPDFAVLFARVRDRIANLSGLYGAGPLEIDFRALGERAASVRMTRSELERVEVTRQSSRTGQTHPLGGFVGFAEYEGDLAEFVPFLEAAEWTGVGRQTVWGKGAIHVVRQ